MKYRPDRRPEGGRHGANVNIAQAAEPTFTIRLHLFDLTHHHTTPIRQTLVVLGESAPAQDMEHSVETLLTVTQIVHSLVVESRKRRVMKKDLQAVGWYIEPPQEPAYRKTDVQ